MPDPTKPNRTVAASQDQNASSASSADETAPLGSGKPTFGAPAAPGEVGVLGPYRVVKQLGAGGMGAVYLALDTRLDRKLALKVMLPEFAADRDAKERFLREAKAAAKISHDNVVTVYEADERDGVPYIAMQFLQGYPLDEYLRTKGAPALPHVIRIAREAALGLAAAHELGFVHRDIKPANLWLEAPNGRVKVLDFGLAKPVGTDAELTKSGAVLGTPAYMSPEQARGLKVDSRTDLFSLGAVLYRLCTGRTPFAGPNVMAVLMALGTDDPVPVRELNPHVPELLAQLIHQLLAKKPEQRPQTAPDVANRLRAISNQLLAPSAPGAVAPSAPEASGADLSMSRPVVVHPIPHQPPVVVPMQVTAAPEDVFAHLGDEDANDTDTDTDAPEETPPQPKGGKGGLIAVGVAVLLAAVAVAVVVSQMGTKGKPRAPAPTPGSELSVVPVSAPAPTPPPTSTSLLSGLDLARDALSGSWSWDGDALVVPVVSRADGGLSSLVVPQTMPDEYDLTIMAERRSGIDYLSIRIPVGGQRVGVILDGMGGSVSGLETIDAKGVLENPTRTNGAVFSTGKAVRIDVTVRKNRVTVSTGGRRLFEWTGRPDQLSDHYNLPRSAGLVLGAWESSFRVTELTLRMSGDRPAGEPTPDEALARAVLRRGGAVEGSAGGDAKVRVSHAAELPAAGFRLRTLRLGPSRYNWDAALARLPECDSVEVVRADYADLTDAGVAALGRFPKVRDLAVAGSRLTDGALAAVAKLAGLKTLLVGEDQFSAAALTQFRADRPECDVVIVPTDRVAAEAVLLLNEQTPVGYEWPAVVTVRTSDGTSHSVRSILGLPTNPFRVTSLVLPQLLRVPDWRVAVFRNLPELDAVHAWGCWLTNEALFRWDGLPKLRSISIGYSQVTTAGVRSLTRFPSLAALNLNNSGFDDTTVEALSDLKGLVELSIENVPVSDASIPAWAQLTGLRTLGMRRIRMTADGVAKLQKALPNCKITWDEPKK